jgi:hypothetical protein
MVGDHHHDLNLNVNVLKTNCARKLQVLQAYSYTIPIMFVVGLFEDSHRSSLHQACRVLELSGFSLSSQIPRS